MFLFKQNDLTFKVAEPLPAEFQARCWAGEAHRVWLCKMVPKRHTVGWGKCLSQVSCERIEYYGLVGSWIIEEEIGPKQIWDNIL